jgi:hypothetical protein
VALPRYSFVRAVLESCQGAATILRVTLGAWWDGEVRIGRRRGPRGLGPHDPAGYRPQPLSAFPELQRLIVHEPGFADPSVRAQRVWEDVGFGGACYEYFILSNVYGRRTLGMLMREHDPAYLRLYSNLAFAAVDSALWAREIRNQPVRHPFALGGVDPLRHCTWSVLVVQRTRRCELQITTGGLIPWTRDFKSVEEATLGAEVWLTEFMSSRRISPRTDLTASVRQG